PKAQNSAAAIAWRSFISNPRELLGVQKTARSLVGARYASMTNQRALNALFAEAYAERVRSVEQFDAGNPLSRIAKARECAALSRRDQIATVL
ncbi:MAG: hypothetical protein ABW186_09980, partial [Rhodanobacteraceae bacterium]